MEYILPVIFLGLLCAAWVGIQFLAKRMNTKNHFDDLNSYCGNCTCGGMPDSCTKEKEPTAELS